jgi:CRP/FNR family transcriptional regulator
MIDPDVIRRIPRFADISQPALEEFCRRAAVRTLERGETVFLEGDACTHFYMVVSGEVKVLKVLESGREVILGIFHAGEAIGEVAIMDGDVFPADAAAQKSTTVLTLPCKDYLALLERYPEVGRSIIRDLTLRVRALRTRVEILSESGVQARIALLLRSFAREMGHQENGALFVPVKLSRAEIAGMVGARTETVIRIMSRWQKEGIVLSDGRGFKVENPTALDEIAAHED